MTIEEAVKQLIKSDNFKNISKQKTPLGSKYRMFVTRFERGESKNGVAIDFLLKHGYGVKITKPN